jgi:hypothetical protein
VLLGCEEDPPPPEPVDPPQTGFEAPVQTAAPIATARTFVVTDLAFVDLDSEGVADGFDLDGVEGPATCGQQDLTTPDGRTGIDNQLAGLMPILRMTEAAALDGLVQESVNGGLTMYLIDVVGVEGDWSGDDAAVAVRIRQGGGPTPILDTEGRIESDQTFTVHPDSPDNQSDARLQGGVLTSDDFPLLLPATVLNASFTLEVPVARMELTFNADGSADGILGGAVLIQGFIDLANTVATSIGPLATNLLRSRADLLPDADGRCTAMSAYFRVHLKPAFIADWE